MAARASTSLSAITRTDAQVYTLAYTAFVHAKVKNNASIRDAARWMRVAPITVMRWLKREAPVNPLLVLRSRRLSKHFLACLRVMDRMSNRV